MTTLPFTLTSALKGLLPLAREVGSHVKSSGYTDEEAEELIDVVAELINVARLDSNFALRSASNPFHDSEDFDLGGDTDDDDDNDDPRGAIYTERPDLTLLRGGTPTPPDSADWRNALGLPPARELTEIGEERDDTDTGMDPRPTPLLSWGERMRARRAVGPQDSDDVAALISTFKAAAFDRMHSVLRFTQYEINGGFTINAMVKSIWSGAAYPTKHDRQGRLRQPSSWQRRNLHAYTKDGAMDAARAILADLTAAGVLDGFDVALEGRGNGYVNMRVRPMHTTSTWRVVPACGAGARWGEMVSRQRDGFRCGKHEGGRIETDGNRVIYTLAEVL